MVRFACSVMLQGGKGGAEKCHWPVWGVLAVFQPHWVCTCSLVCAFTLHCSGSWLLYMKQALHYCGSSFRVFHKDADSIGPAFCAFPMRAAQAARSLMGTLSPGAVHLIPSAVPASVSTCASQVCVPCVCSQELASSHDPPGGCQPSRISGSIWLQTGSLFAIW